MTVPPIPPSDNLYKFTAISGVILFVLSLYVPVERYTELNNSMSDLNTKRGQLLLERGHVGEDLQELEKRAQLYLQKMEEIQADLDAKKAQYNRDYDIPQILSEWTAIERDLRKIKSKIRENDLLWEQSKSTSEKLEGTKFHVETLVQVSHVTYWVGFAVAIWGFGCWYFRFQRYQDRIVKAQAEQWTKPKPETTDRDELPG